MKQQRRRSFIENCANSSEEAINILSQFFETQQRKHTHNSYNALPLNSWKTTCPNTMVDFWLWWRIEAGPGYSLVFSCWISTVYTAFDRTGILNTKLAQSRSHFINICLLDVARNSVLLVAPLYQITIQLLGLVYLEGWCTAIWLEFTCCHLYNNK